MKCTKCGGGTHVVNSRPDKHNTIMRRRECKECGLRETSYEAFPDPDFLAEIDRLADQIEAGNAKIKPPLKTIRERVLRESGGEV